MLGPASGRLFLELDNIHRNKRTPYENMLHQELIELANRPSEIAESSCSAGAFLRATLEQIPGLRVEVDLGGSGDDYDVKMRCANPKCPKKRR